MRNELIVQSSSQNWIWQSKPREAVVDEETKDTSTADLRTLSFPPNKSLPTIAVDTLDPRSNQLPPYCYDAEGQVYGIVFVLGPGVSMDHYVCPHYFEV